MTKSLRYAAPLVLLLCVACGGNKTTETSTPSQDTAAVADNLPDTSIATDTATLYGVCVPQGMSTFGFAMGKEELSLSRTDDAGRIATISGSVVEGDSFAITADLGSEVLFSAINLTQLRKHLPTAVVSNGTLYAPNAAGQVEEAEITWMDNDSLCVLFGSQERRTFK